jgi:hypothetical protein
MIFDVKNPEITDTRKNVVIPTDIIHSIIGHVDVSMDQIWSIIRNEFESHFGKKDGDSSYIIYGGGSSVRVRETLKAVAVSEREIKVYYVGATEMTISIMFNEDDELKSYTVYYSGMMPEMVESLIISNVITVIINAIHGVL